MTTPEDKRIKKLLKKFFKKNTNFKEVPERKGCDAIMMFSKKNLHDFTIFLNDDLNKDVIEAVESGLLNLIFLKNTNPRDSKKATYGIIKHSKPSISYNR